MSEFLGGSYKLIQRDSILMLALRNESVARYPIVKDIVKKQTRAILLFDTRLIWSTSAEVPYAYRDQRVALRRCEMLLRHSGEDESGVSAHYPQHRFDFFFG